jgi:Putative Actinobacterial Holin-X, holin superfamily III
MMPAREGEPSFMAYSETNRPISAAVVDLASQFSALIRKEGQLARAEMSEQIGGFGVGLAFVVGGSVLLIPAVVILLQAAVARLAAAGLAVGWASLVAGGATLLFGLALLAIGIGRLRAGRLVPGKTIHQLQRDAAIATEQLRNGHGNP